MYAVPLGYRLIGKAKHLYPCAPIETSINTVQISGTEYLDASDQLRQCSYLVTPPPAPVGLVSHFDMQEMEKWLPAFPPHPLIMEAPYDQGHLSVLKLFTHLLFSGS